MRHILTTALVALVVGAIAGATVGALAQEPAVVEPAAAAPAAVSTINADRVDGKHAVGARASIVQRRNKLVATNKQGYLPANILKNPGVTKVTITAASGSVVTVEPGGWGSAYVSCPAGSKAISGGAWSFTRYTHATDSYPAGTGDGWTVWAHNTDTVAHDFRAYAVCLATTPAAGLASSSKDAAPAGRKAR